MAHDPAKEAINFGQHGYTFDGCEEIFDFVSFTKPDRSTDYTGPDGLGEQRWKTIGIVAGVAMVLIHTERDGEIRPISYREALIHEIEELEAAHHGNNRRRRPRHPR